MFSKLGGETTEKHSKKTSVWGYDKGRRRLLVSIRSMTTLLLVILLSGGIPQTE